MDTQKRELKNELKRIRRVSDMLTSMHSMLRDEYATKSTILDCSLFASSIILAALVFVDPVLLGWAPLSATASRLLLGTFALISFFLSLVIFRVDWKSKADLHKCAAESYSNMKLDCQAMFAIFDDTGDSEIQKLIVRYNDLGRICIAIPEGSFLRLKQKHMLKVALSKYLDENPGASLFLLKIKMRWSGNFKKSAMSSLKQDSEANSDNEDNNSQNGTHV